MSTVAASTVTDFSSKADLNLNHLVVDANNVMIIK